MKLIATVALMSLSLNTFALDLACFLDKTLETSSGNVDAITLKNVESEELESTLPDQGTMHGFELAENGKTYTAGFSNECDNDYSVTFPAKTFAAMIAGKNVKEIRGTVTYAGADETSSKTRMTCRPL